MATRPLRVVKAAEVEIFRSRGSGTSRNAGQDYGDQSDDYNSDILNDSLADSDEEEEKTGTSFACNDNLEDSICSSPLPFKIRTADEFMSFLAQERTRIDLSGSSSFDDSDAERDEEKSPYYGDKFRVDTQANAKKDARPSPNAYAFRSKPSNNIPLSPPKQRNSRPERRNLSGVATTATSTRKVIKRNAVATAAATSTRKATQRTTSAQAQREAKRYNSRTAARPPKLWNIREPSTSSESKKHVKKNKVKSRTRQRSKGTARVYDRCVPPRMNAPTVEIDARPSKDGIRVMWTSTAPNNGPPPSRYELQQRRSSDGIWKTVSAELTDTHCVIANAIPGERYSFRVRAHNCYGWAQRWSALSKATVLARDARDTSSTPADACLSESVFIRTKQDRAMAIQREAQLLRQNRRGNARDSPFSAFTPRSAVASEPDTYQPPHHDRRVLRPSHTSPTRTAARAPPAGTLSMQARQLEQSLAKLDARLADNRWHQNRYS